MKEGHIIKASDDLPLHLVNCCHTPCHMETELCCSPILFDEVELAVILRVEITQMSTGLNQLLKLGLLGHEVGLRKENTPAAAVSVARGTMKAQALGKKISLSRPQITFPNDNLHALEPAGHGGVVFREVKCLGFAVWECDATHA
jgi:hypothetical protein